MSQKADAREVAHQLDGKADGPQVKSLCLAVEEGARVHTLALKGLADRVRGG